MFLRIFSCANLPKVKQKYLWTTFLFVRLDKKSFVWYGYFIAKIHLYE